PRECDHFLKAFIGSFTAANFANSTAPALDGPQAPAAVPSCPPRPAHHTPAPSRAGLSEIFACVCFELLARAGGAARPGTTSRAAAFRNHRVCPLFCLRACSTMIQPRARQKLAASRAWCL